MIKYRVKIIDIIEEALDTKTYILEKPEEFSWLEGAHTHIGLLGFDEGEKPNKNWVRHMSIMTLPEDDNIGFTTRIKEPFTEFKEKLSKLHVGDEVILFKIGSRMFLRREFRSIILISMGVGIATMRPLIRSFIKDKADIPQLININIDSSNNFIYKNTLDTLTDLDYQNYWMNTRSKLYKLLDKVTGNKQGIYYLVGSDTFLIDIIKYLNEKKIDQNSIILDKKDELIPAFFTNE